MNGSEGGRFPLADERWFLPSPAKEAEDGLFAALRTVESNRRQALVVLCLLELQQLVVLVGLAHSQCLLTDEAIEFRKRLTAFERCGIFLNERNARRALCASWTDQVLAFLQDEGRWRERRLANGLGLTSRRLPQPDQRDLSPTVPSACNSSLAWMPLPGCLDVYCVLGLSTAETRSRRTVVATSHKEWGLCCLAAVKDYRVALLSDSRSAVVIFHRLHEIVMEEQVLRTSLEHSECQSASSKGALLRQLHELCRVMEPAVAVESRALPPSVEPRVKPTRRILTPFLPRGLEAAFVLQSSIRASEAQAASAALHSRLERVRLRSLAIESTPLSQPPS
jgi:hypothetical protein